MILTLAAKKEILVVRVETGCQLAYCIQCGLRVGWISQMWREMVGSKGGSEDRADSIC